MAGTKAGGIKAAKTNKKLHGKNFYKEIGAKGGSACVETKGFGADRERARLAGQKGGKISKRGKAKNPRTPHLSDEEYAICRGKAEK